MRKIISSVICVCVLFFSLVTVPCAAIAGIDDLVVIGGTVMTMGLLGSLGIMSLNAAGASDAFINGARALGHDVKDFGDALFASYARSQNITAGQAVQIAQQGTSYLEDGKIIFNQTMSNMMDGFVNWAWSDEGGGLINYATSSGGYVDISKIDKSILSRPNGTYILYPSVVSSITYIGANNREHHFSFTSPVYAVRECRSASVSTLLFYSDSPFTITETTSSTTSDYSSQSVSRNGITYYYRTSPYQGKSILDQFSLSTVMDGDSYVVAYWDVAYLIYNGSIQSGYDVNLDILSNVGADEVGVFDPDSVIEVTDVPVNGGTIDIQDWIDSITEAILEGVSSIPIVIDEATTIDVAIELAAEDAIPVDITGSIAGADSIADSTSISGLDDYTLNLIDFFPFCIPFDIYRMLQLFSSSREAPGFDYRFYVPGVVDEMIRIDLSSFDSVAAVLRQVELIAAAIGLAFVTKKLIQGGD